MNNDRRKRLDKIMADIEARKASFRVVGEAVTLMLNPVTDALVSIKEDLESIRDEEREAFDNLPEGLQQAEKGQNMEAAIEAMENAMGNLDDLRDALTFELPEESDFDDIVTQVDEAKAS
jgi:hypothetical protein